jgi:hypothetical protein
MNKWKAFAVFFTLLFFGGLSQTMYLVFSASERGDAGRPALIVFAIVFNLVILFLAVRSWRKTFRHDK